MVCCMKEEKYFVVELEDEKLVANNLATVSIPTLREILKKMNLADNMLLNAASTYIYVRSYEEQLHSLQ